MCVACSRDWRSKFARSLIWIAAVLLACRYAAAEPSALAVAEPSHPGWKILKSRPFLPPDFDQSTFDLLHLTWPDFERTKAAALPLNDRRRIIAEH